jgi:DNA polymerase V
MGADRALNIIFKKGYPYAKAGVLLSQFSHPTFIQHSLFDSKSQDQLKQDTNLMQAIDALNSSQTQIYYASQLSLGESPIQKKMVSPRYTTNWWELPTTK